MIDSIYDFSSTVIPAEAGIQKSLIKIDFGKKYTKNK
jgi:hypothetical protein